jgi:Rha family phage regulatory protein
MMEDLQIVGIIKDETAITNLRDKAVTTSLHIAKVFGKEHYNVLRDIERLDCSGFFHKLNFEFMQRTLKIGNGAERKEPYYAITKDGFVFLVMGYRGKKAAQFKEAYINAFNQMEQYIIQEQQEEETWFEKLAFSVLEDQKKERQKNYPPYCKLIHGYNQAVKIEDNNGNIYEYNDNPEEIPEEWKKNREKYGVTKPRIKKCSNDSKTLETKLIDKKDKKIAKENKKTSLNIKSRTNNTKDNISNNPNGGKNER